MREFWETRASSSLVDIKFSGRLVAKAVARGATAEKCTKFCV